MPVTCCCIPQRSCVQGCADETAQKLALRVRDDRRRYTVPYSVRYEITTLGSDLCPGTPMHCYGGNKFKVCNDGSIVPEFCTGDWPVGEYYLIWYYQRSDGDPVEAVEKTFCVCSTGLLDEKTFMCSAEITFEIQYEF